MTRSVAGVAVVAELGDGTLTVRWPAAGVTFGPFHAEVTSRGGRIRSEGPGEWSVDAGAAVGRAGTWARWTSAVTGMSIGVHVPEDGPIVVVEADFTATASTIVDAIAPVDGETDLPVDRRLVDGYESWSYSGVRGADAGCSFWNSAYVAGDGRALVLQALDAHRLCTRIMNDDVRLRVECGANPALVKEPGTWGYRTAEPPGLGLALDAGGTLRSPAIAIAAGRDPAAVVEHPAALAGAAMGARRWSGAPIRGWESWYEYGLFVTAEDVLANARLLRTRYPEHLGFDVVQLDDGWQRTYGAWWPNERFPDDLGELVGELRALGCRAGVWIAPFRVQPDAPGLGTEHPEWCIRRPDDAPLMDERHNAWALDASNPRAVDWIRELGGQVRSWGFDMVKVDFCFLGAFEGGRHDARTTGVEALRRGMSALVDELGDDMYVLGCGMPMLPAIGLCHGNRIGHDLAMPRVHQDLGHPVDEGWHGFTGIQAGARNLSARWAQAGRWYDADPDVVMAWGADGADPAGYSTEEARTLVTMGVVSGGPFFLADALASLDDAGRAVLEHLPVLELLDVASFRPVDVFERADGSTVPEHAYARGPGIATVWRAEGQPRRLAVFFNWDHAVVRRQVPVDLVGATELWTGERVGEELLLPAHGARVVVA